MKLMNFKRGPQVEPRPFPDIHLQFENDEKLKSESLQKLETSLEKLDAENFKEKVESRNQKFCF